MDVVVSAIVDPWVTTLSFVVALAMRIQGHISVSNRPTVTIYSRFFFYSPFAGCRHVRGVRKWE